jgi:hypothetical protein
MYFKICLLAGENQNLFNAEKEILQAKTIKE